MKLKVYRARTMAEALAEVKKDLGSAAVILHTRQNKVGGVLGFGTKTVYEVTATNDAGVAKNRTAARRETARRAPASATTQPSRSGLASTLAARAYTQVDRVETPRVNPPQAAQPTQPNLTSRQAAASKSPPETRLAENPQVSAAEHVAATEMKAQTLRVRGRTPAAEAPASRSQGAEMRSELASMKKMLAEVLRSQRTSPAANVGTETDALFQTYLELTESGVPHEIADDIVGRTRDELGSAALRDPSEVRAEARRQVQRRVRVVDEHVPPAKQPGERPRIVACVGPTGVGKTTTIAKLAACYKLRHQRRVGLVTCDTYRIAAVEQLRTYADIIGIPLKVVLTPAEMHAAIASLTDCDIILIDTAGRSPRDASRLTELKETLSLARPDETHLVLAATSSRPVIERIAQNFGELKPNRVIVTKIDEAVGLGNLSVIGECLKVPISYTTHGQEVPDHIEAATLRSIARLVLPDPEPESPVRPASHPEPSAISQAVGGAA